MSYARNLETRVAQTIVTDLANHTITEKHRHGFYGHWRCQKGNDSNLYFDIITWPGTLAICGDMGDFVFQRTTDMIAFMRGSAMSFGYAAEKCVSIDRRVGMEEWRPERVHEHLDQLLEEHADDQKPCGMSPAKFVDVVDSVRRAAGDREHFANERMYDSGLFDGCDWPNCKAFTYHFLWCLHAIKWFCDNVETKAEMIANLQATP